MVRKYNIYVGDGNFATIHNSGIEMYKNHLSYYTNLYSMKNNPFQALCLLYQWHCFLSYFPPHMWFHLVFHVLNLEPYDLNSIPCCDFPPPPCIELDEGLDYHRKGKPNHLNQKLLGKSWNQTEPFNRNFKPNH